MSEVEIKLRRLHPAQKQILAEAGRFNVLKCGRRFGKTELTKELSINPMLDGQFVGYWCPTYKDLYEVWQELIFTLSPVIESKNSQVHQIKLITGGKIDMWSLDDPDGGRGRKYHRAIIDEAEKARHLKDAWENTIRATLVDYQGDAWFMSTPKFGQTYFKEVLFTNKEQFPDWRSWRFTTYDNPFMPKEEIDAARLQLDDLTFRCEYLAEDVDISLRPFAYSFDEERHVSAVDYDPSFEVMISFDFNVDPITCLLAQHREIDGKMTLCIFDEFQLANSNIYAICDQIIAKYGHANPVWMITGDATGQGRSAMTSGNVNYYRVIRTKLNVSNNQILVTGVNPAVSDTRVLMNSLFQNYEVRISPNCKGFIRDCKYVQVDDFGDIVKDRKSEVRKSDLLDCGRYLMHTFFKWFVKLNNNS